MTAGPSHSTGLIAPPDAATLCRCRGQSPLNFEKVIDTVAGFLESQGAPFAPADAFALHAYGLSRATTDVDFVTRPDMRDRLLNFSRSFPRPSRPGSRRSLALVGRALSSLRTSTVAGHRRAPSVPPF
jgi:hypothetical protein